MEREREIWFPAKRYGWGWGPPVTWQGWLVLAVFVGAILYIALRFPPNSDPVLFIALVLLTVLGLMIVCWWKGETPRWRWGEDK